MMCDQDRVLRWREEGGSRDVRQEQRMCDGWPLQALQEALAREGWEAARHRNEQLWVLTRHGRV